MTPASGPTSKVHCVQADASSTQVRFSITMRGEKKSAFFFFFKEMQLYLATIL